jgi:hypothetical protein
MEGSRTITTTKQSRTVGHEVRACQAVGVRCAASISDAAEGFKWVRLAFRGRDGGMVG